MNYSKIEFNELANSIAHNLKIKSAFADFLKQHDFQFHVTANFNRVTTLNNGREKLKLWSSRVDRKLFGGRYHKKKIDERVFFVAIPEYGNSSLNLHYHMMVRVPENRHEAFTKSAESIWKQFNPTGSLFIQPIGNTQEDKDKVIGYDLKEAWQKNCLENIIFSTEFSNWDSSGLSTKDSKEVIGQEEDGEAGSQEKCIGTDSRKEGKSSPEDIKTL